MDKLPVRSASKSTKTVPIQDTNSLLVVRIPASWNSPAESPVDPDASMLPLLNPSDTLEMQPQQSERQATETKPHKDLPALVSHYKESINKLYLPQLSSQRANPPSVKQPVQSVPQPAQLLHEHKPERRILKQNSLLNLKAKLFSTKQKQPPIPLQPTRRQTDFDEIDGILNRLNRLDKISNQSYVRGPRRRNLPFQLPAMPEEPLAAAGSPAGYASSGSTARATTNTSHASVQAHEDPQQNSQKDSQIDLKENLKESPVEPLQRSSTPVLSDKDPFGEIDRDLNRFSNLPHNHPSIDLSFYDPYSPSVQSIHLNLQTTQETQTVQDHPIYQHLNMHENNPSNQDQESAKEIIQSSPNSADLEFPSNTQFFPFQNQKQDLDSTISNTSFFLANFNRPASEFHESPPSYLYPSFQQASTNPFVSGNPFVHSTNPFAPSNMLMQQPEAASEQPFHENQTDATHLQTNMQPNQIMTPPVSVPPSIPSSPKRNEFLSEQTTEVDQHDPLNNPPSAQNENTHLTTKHLSDMDASRHKISSESETDAYQIQTDRRHPASAPTSPSKMHHPIQTVPSSAQVVCLPNYNHREIAILNLGNSTKKSAQPTQDDAFFCKKLGAVAYMIHNDDSDDSDNEDAYEYWRRQSDLVQSNATFSNQFNLNSHQRSLSGPSFETLSRQDYPRHKRIENPTTISTNDTISHSRIARQQINIPRPSVSTNLNQLIPQTRPLASAAEQASVNQVAYSAASRDMSPPTSPLQIQANALEAPTSPSGAGILRSMIRSVKSIRTMRT